ncbi:MerR family transcriptional regulator [Parafannyhessea umbonata]|uniref:MerR family transcriptional regulator n=1 Tax=Parafannyhessea umbonata TaxID=604330 RepID=UPI00359C6EA8
MYTIGQVSKMFGLPISTLRYYDKEGLFPSMSREGGIRRFGDQELEALRVIECLKRSGLEIREIKRFMQWCEEGPSTYAERGELFERRREAVLQQMEQLRKTLAMLEYKCWYYKVALADGNEDRLDAMVPNGLPKDVRALYDEAHA